ncbi:MAG: hypothetical protein K2I96_17415 [Lachnospiraceae bacterium]|nr:hypothetical protein [Lachnospiraceae bacterium]
MKKTTLEYYKAAVRQAGNAREDIERANADYEHGCVLAKNALDAGISGENGYKGDLERLAQERDAKIEGALCRIDKVGEEYAEEMAELGRLDGSRIDEGAMKLLNSGLQLTNEDWQELANTHKDNHVMTRILRERYNANRPKSDGNGLTFVQFGQSPQDRQENFVKFIRTLHNSCTYSSMPRNGTVDFASRQDYHNFLAKDSLGRMKPFGDESFDTVEQDFPVAYVQAKPTIW